MPTRIAEFTISGCLDPVRSFQSSFVPPKGTAGNFFSIRGLRQFAELLTGLTIYTQYAYIVLAMLQFTVAESRFSLSFP